MDEIVKEILDKTAELVGLVGQLTQKYVNDVIAAKASVKDSLAVVSGAPADAEPADQDAQQAEPPVQAEGNGEPVPAPADESTAT